MKLLTSLFTERLFFPTNFPSFVRKTEELMLEVRTLILLKLLAGKLFHQWYEARCDKRIEVSYSIRDLGILREDWETL